MRKPKWRDLPLVVIDVETTGFRWNFDRVIDLGIVVFKIDSDGAKEICASGGLVNPSMPISPEIEGLTGISNEMVEQSPCFLDRFILSIGELVNVPEISALDGTPLFHACGYNGTFDHHFLSMEFARANIQMPEWMASDGMRPNWLDPRVWAEVLDPYAKGKERFKQVNVASKLGITQEGSAHRAINDARVCGRIAGEFAKSDRLPKDWEDLLWSQRVHAANQEARILNFINEKKERENG